MAHTVHGKKKLLARVRRIRGQVEALERMLDNEHDCFAVLQNAAACRGALNGLMAELIAGHVTHHVLDPRKSPSRSQHEAADQLLDIVRAYLK